MNHREKVFFLLPFFFFCFLIAFYGGTSIRERKNLRRNRITLLDDGRCSRSLEAPIMKWSFFVDAGGAGASRYFLESAGKKERKKINSDNHQRVKLSVQFNVWQSETGKAWKCPSRSESERRAPARQEKGSQEKATKEKKKERRKMRRREEAARSC